MSETVTVAAVSSNEPREYIHQPSGNRTLYYKVRFTEYPDRVVEWGMKPPNKPEVGQKVEGDFKNDPKWGWGFKRNSGNYGGGGLPGKASDFRTREQIIMQCSDEAAATLILAAAQASVPIDAVLKDFYKASAALQERVSQAGKPYGEEKPPEVRKDIERTGQTDVPAEDGFEQPQMTTEPDDIPF